MTGSAPDTAINEFASEVLHRKLRALRKERKGVRAAEDREYLHRMRVASRRLRAAMVVFEDCFPHKRFRIWRRQTKRLTKALGAARDCDVQIAFVHEFLVNNGQAPLRPGLERLVLRLEQRRADLQRTVIHALDRFDDAGVALDIQDALWALEPETDENPSGSARTGLYRLAALEIAARLDRMLLFEPFLADLERTAEHHAMRIAAKHLRYTLEIFAPVYENGLRSSLQAVRKMQDVLGEMHDCDVWVKMIPEMIEEERSKTLRYFGNSDAFEILLDGMNAVSADRLRMRSELHSHMIAHWTQLKECREWETLRDLAESLAK